MTINRRFDLRDIPDAGLDLIAGLRRRCRDRAVQAVAGWCALAAIVAFLIWEMR